MRFLFKAFIVLLLLNTLLFFVHYKDSSIVTAKNKDETSYDQEIEIVHRANELLIRHHFTNLSTNRLEINWPKTSEKRTCRVEDADSCVRLNEETTAFLEGEETSQSISYVIPKEPGGDEDILLRSIFAKIHKATPQATVLHIIDEVHEGGMWITGLQQVGNQTLNLVNYTLFSGSGAVSDLYWQKQQLPNESNEYVTVYGADSMEFIEQFDKLFTQLNAAHMDIVLNDQNQNIASSRFLVTHPTELSHALEQFAVNQFYMNYDEVSIDRFTAEVMTALLLDNEFDFTLATNAVKQLRESLTPTQVTRFIERFEEKARELNEEKTMAETVDELIEEVTDYKTSFFTKNSQLEEGFYPFLLENPKKIVVSDGESLENHAIVKDNNIYYPIEEVMEDLAYDVFSNEHSLYIEGHEKKYRFPLKRQFYVFNDRRFNIKTIPFEQFNEKFYFEESAMLRIFQLNIENRDEEINLTPTSG